MHDGSDMMDLADDVLACWDEFPRLNNVISPLDELILKHGKPAVDEARTFLRRMGLLESEVNKVS